MSAAVGQSLPRTIAHRGGRAWAPENTLAAFRKCVENGVYGVEMDVQRCRTGELVLMHEAWVDDTTDGTGLVIDYDFDRLRQLKAGIKFSPDFASERVPLLSEALEILDGNVVIYLEVKIAPVDYPGIEREVIDLLANCKSPENIVICSFDHESLMTFRGLTSKFKTAMLTCGVPYQLKQYASGLKASALHPDFTAFRAGYVDDAREAGLVVNVWTVNGERDWLRACQSNVAGVITDDPMGFRKFLDEMQKQGDDVKEWRL